MHQPPEFLISVDRPADGGRATVVVSGEIDVVTSREVERVTREALHAGPVLLDLRAVSFMDSSGVRLLDTLVREGAEFQLTPDLQPGVRQILEMTGMDDMLPFAPADGEGA